MSAARHRQSGVALLVILLGVGLLAAYFAVSALNRSLQNERQRLSLDNLSQAKDALMGFAATYRDGHPGESPGRLPCPDMTQTLPSPAGGQASVAPDCPNAGISAIGRLPWQTLGVPPLRDRAGECLWYAVSGSAKTINPVTPYNWDTLGQFIIRDAGGNVFVGATPHTRALAVLLSPGVTLSGPGQTRPTAGTPPPECGGTANLNNYTAYLEGVGAPWPPAANATTTITLADAASMTAGANNDTAVWVTPQEVFDRVKRRSDFRFDIDTMLSNIATCISSQPVISSSFPQNKGLGRRTAPIPPNNLLDDFTANCPPAGRQVDLLAQWQNNLLYMNPGAASTLTQNGITYSGCSAILLFGGERTAGQTRATPLQTGDDTNPGDKTQYLEGTTATLFPAAGAYVTAAGFNSKNASADLARCIKPYTGHQASFASNFGSFTTAGVGVTRGTSNGTTPPGAPPGLNTVSINNAAGANGGCFWYPVNLQMAGKVLRAHYDFWFTTSDPVGGADRGNGFTLQIVRGDRGAPGNCGTQANMGVLNAADLRGNISWIIETDVHRDAANNDPAGNHVAILYGGNLTHSLTNGNPTAACDGTAAGCLFSPANKFEESIPVASPPPPSQPAPHSQRIEIHTGCNATCTQCNMAAPLPTNSTRVTVWGDCKDCSDLGGDIDRAAVPPSMSRCILPTPEMNTVYLGLTGGFRTGGSLQGVTLWNFGFRTE